MSARMHQHETFLKLIAATSPRQRKAMLESASPGQILAICETALNILNQLIPLSEGQIQKLHRHRHIIRTLADSKVSVAKKRSHLLKQKGGFFTLLIPPALEILRALSS